jgi:hypothetical protein
VVLLEEPIETVVSVRLQQPRGRPFERQALEIRFVGWNGEAVEHLLHEGPARNRIAALDVGAKIGRRTVHHRLRHICLSQTRHAHGQRRRFAEAREHVRVHRDGRDAILLQCRREPDDRRAAGASKADA